VWAVSVVSYIALCRWLVPDFPLWIVAGFGLLWSPLNSYVSARMVGLTGQGVSVPFIKEVAIISSRYPRVDIWYAPLPLYDHGWAAQRFREVELTGTKFTSILKAELVMLPVIFLASFIFWAFFWKASPIPSPLFPFAQKMWPYYAQMEAVWKQINLPQSEIREVVLNALNIPRIITGFVSGLGLFWLFSAFKWPVLLFYGLVSGVGQLPHFTLPKLLGAWLGHRYFKKSLRRGELDALRARATGGLLLRDGANRHVRDCACAGRQVGLRAAVLKCLPSPPVSLPRSGRGGIPLFGVLKR
jgi:hypothetical protein